jgi:LysM repeat protein
MFLTNTVSHANSFLMHTAKAGDSYFYISEKYNVTINELKALNEDSDDIIYEGSLVKVKPISKNITIKIDNITLQPDQSPYIENNRTFVPIRFIAEALNIDKILWDDSSKTATLMNNEKTIKLTLGSHIANVNGKDIKLDAPISIYKGRTYIPIRFISEIFDCIVSWDNSSSTVLIDTKSTYNEDLYWLSRIIEAEAQGEPFEGKLAVGNVVVNRKNSPNFPNTIKKVIFDTNYGYQYTPVLNGTIYNSPSWESIKAAKMVLAGNNNISNCLYFLNPRKSTNTWIIKNRTFYKSIGLHDFYR